MVHADIIDVINGITILSDVSFESNGTPRVLPTTQEQDTTQRLVSALEGDIYAQYYIRPWCRTQHVQNIDVSQLKTYVSRLSVANCGNGTWEPGWKVDCVESAQQVAVSRDGITFWVDSSSIRANGDLARGM